jgi:DNA-binding CsgD family transcriptional regulator
LSQALRLKPDIVLINISVLTGDWSKLVKQIIEELPRTLLAAGHAMKEIAYRLGITYRTVTFRKYRMMERLGIKSTAGLMSYALNRNLSEGFASANQGKGQAPAVM